MLLNKKNFFLILLSILLFLSKWIFSFSFFDENLDVTSCGNASAGCNEDNKRCLTHNLWMEFYSYPISDFTILIRAFEYLKKLKNGDSLKQKMDYFSDFAWGDNLTKVKPIIERFYTSLGGTITKINRDVLVKSRIQIKKQLSKLSKSTLIKMSVPEIKHLYKYIIYTYIIKPCIDRYGFIKPTYLSLPVTDLYLFARMFTTFDKSKMYRSPEGCKMTQIPKNVIVYGGFAHTKMINELLKHIFGNPLYSYDRDIYNIQNCVPFNEKHQFF